MSPTPRRTPHRAAHAVSPGLGYGPPHLGTACEDGHGLPGPDAPHDARYGPPYRTPCAHRYAAPHDATPERGGRRA
jgi:hypothetical protein